MRLFFACLLGLAILSGCGSEVKTAFVKGHELFEAFDGKKELQARLEQEKNKHTSVLDSLRIQITAMERGGGQPTQLQQLRQQYEILFMESQSSYQAKENQYVQEIWGQLNEYTQQYGEENGYDYIFGAMGNGSLMYGRESRDITIEVIEYVNQKYAGY